MHEVPLRLPPDIEADGDDSVIADRANLRDLLSREVPKIQWRILDRIRPPEKDDRDSRRSQSSSTQ